MSTKVRAAPGDAHAAPGNAHAVPGDAHAAPRDAHAAPGDADAAPVAAPAPAVRATALVKRFGDLVALGGLDLEVPAGAFYAFLGPNGAGKSTTLKILTGVLEPDAGEVRVLGRDVTREPEHVKARIGVVPEELSLFERLTGRQQLVFSARMYGLPAAEAEGRAEELLALTDLTARADALVAEYSKGMRRKLAIAAALIHRPEVIFLDEPFEGIDVLAAGVVRELLRELSRRGVTLLLTTHVLEIADRLATHAGIVDDGRMVDQGTVSALLARHGQPNLEGVFEALVGAPASRGAGLSFYGGGAAPADAADPGADTGATGGNRGAIGGAGR